jgi:hypothetical protein
MTVSSVSSRGSLHFLQQVGHISLLSHLRPFRLAHPLLLHLLWCSPVGFDDKTDCLHQAIKPHRCSASFSDMLGFTQLSSGALTNTYLDAYNVELVERLISCCPALQLFRKDWYALCRK